VWADPALQLWPREPSDSKTQTQTQTQKSQNVRIGLISLTCPSFFMSAVVRSTTAGSVNGAGTISTRGMKCGGLTGCATKTWKENHKRMFHVTQQNITLLGSRKNK
jgi:hypothetical protein